MSSDPPAVEGVAYTIHETGLRMFRCDDQAATLSTKGCASRHLAAVKASPGAEGCGRCPIGAAHAGRPVVHYAPAFATDRCPRCGFGTERMIANRLCVGCYNREREIRAGRNGRGNRPVNLPSLVELPIRCAVDGRGQRPTRRVVATDHQAKVKTGNRDRRGRPEYAIQERGGTLEAMAQTVRTMRGVIDFQALRTAPDAFWQQELAL